MGGEFGRRGVASLALNFSQRRHSGIARMCQPSLTLIRSSVLCHIQQDLQAPI